MREVSIGVLYPQLYAEQLAENASDCRDRERRALDHAIALLGTAATAGPQSKEAIEALDFVGKLWNVFIQDLVDPENDLPNALKADIISIGLWIIKGAALIRCGELASFGNLIEICSIIRDGLK
jgi:flagellar biosynthesis activator protein FlaF